MALARQAAAPRPATARDASSGRTSFVAAARTRTNAHLVLSHPADMPGAADTGTYRTKHVCTSSHRVASHEHQHAKSLPFKQPATLPHHQMPDCANHSQRTFCHTTAFRHSRSACGPLTGCWDHKSQDKLIQATNRRTHLRRRGQTRQ